MVYAFRSAKIVIARSMTSKYVEGQFVCELPNCLLTLCIRSKDIF